MDKEGIRIDIAGLEEDLNTKIVCMSVRDKKGVHLLKEAILDYEKLPLQSPFDIHTVNQDYFGGLVHEDTNENPYKLWLRRIQKSDSLEEQKHIKSIQHKETIKRYQLINSVLRKHFIKDPNKATGLRAKLDRILMHKVAGFVVFFLILMIIFQVIYDWSGYPMDLIDVFFAWFSESLKSILPEGVFTDLLTEGIIPGLGGVLIFIPQIAFLFFFIAILEESGYMSRVVFIMDRLMRRFGLSGKSIVPLISGTACAVPAVMASRNIENWKQRLITILIVPFTTCAARLPVYLILIDLIIPEKKIGYFFSSQSVVLMLLYLLGFLIALIAAWLLSKYIKTNTRQYFIIEMPAYKVPLVRNIFSTVFEKTKSFVIDAGKIILAFSVILWALGNYGPDGDLQNVEEIVIEKYSNLSDEEVKLEVARYQLEHSYIGKMGKIIEPIVAPLGYDWKIGIGIITSFAAREIFVGTLATIYSVNAENEITIRERMRAEVHPATGKPVFSFATGVSLLLFYAFAMQCLSTVAIVKKEANSWKWAIVQMLCMTSFAYFCAFLAYQMLK